MAASTQNNPLASQNLPSREVIEQEILCRKAVSFRNDPLGFVRWAYPWGKPGPLEKYPGPDEWQTEFLRELGEEVRKRNFDGVNPVLPIRFTTSSGHGIGKSVLVAFIQNWIMSTREHAQGTVTATQHAHMGDDSNLDKALHYRSMVRSYRRTDVPQAVQRVVVLLGAVLQRG
jgi:hypothetical protein